MTKGNQSLNIGFKWNSLASTSVLLVKVIRGLVVPILLIPSQYGLFTSIGIFTRYLQFSDLGVKQYLGKNLPHIILNLNQKERDKLINETLSFILLTYLIVILYLASIAYLYNGDNKSFYHIAILLLIPITLLSKTTEILSVYSLSFKNYKYPASAEIIKNLLSFVLVIIGIYFGGAIGGVIALVIVEIIVFSYLYSRIKKTFSFTFNFVLNKNVFVRFPAYVKLFLVSISETIINTYDSIIIIILLSAKSLGIYSLGTAFGWPFVALSGILITTIQPEINRYIYYNSLKVERLFSKYFKLFLLLCSVSVNFIFLLLFYLINFHYHKYITGLGFYFVLVSIYIIRSTNFIIRQYFIARNKELIFIYNAITIIIVIIIFTYLMSSFNLSLEKMIYYILAIDLLFFLINLYQIMKMSSVKKKVYVYDIFIILYIIMNGLLAQIIYFSFLSRSSIYLLFLLFVFSAYPIIYIHKMYKNKQLF